MPGRIIFWCSFFFLAGALTTKAQTSTIVSGNWSDATIWSNGIPGNGTVTTVNYPVILDQNIPLVGGVREINISTGYYTFSDNVTDIPDATNIELSIGNGGALDVTAGTTTFLGSGSFDNGSSLYVRSGATLILGSTSIGNNVTILIEAGGTLIINGDLTSGNNNGTFTIAGLVYINGNFSNGGTADVVGTGDIITTGTIDNNSGAARVFGSNEDCSSGPCSGQNLCGFSNSILASQTLCSGTLASDLTGTTDAGTPSYIWEFSTTSSTSGFSSALGTNNSDTYSPGALTQTTWFRRKVTAGSGTGSGCTGTSPAVQITIVPSSAGGWIGFTDSNWNNSANWCNGAVPTSTTDVTIPAGAVNMPQISAAATARDIVINSGATLTVSGAVTLSVYGNLTNNGTFTPGSSGTVSLVGSSPQTVTSNPITIGNLVFNNGAGIVFDVLATVNTSLTLTAGLIDLSGNNITFNATGLNALSYSSGWFYNGALTRSLPVGTFTNANSRLFPLGTADHYRPLYLSRTGTGSAGTLRVSHTGSTLTSDVSVTDGTSTITRRQESSWYVSNLNIPSGTWSINAGGTGFGTVGDVNDLRVMRSADVIGTHGTASGTTTDFLVSRTGIATSQLTNTFYIGSVDAVQTPLPIHLLSFTGYFIESGIMIEWSTASEDNFDHFLLERSIDGINFEGIARITGQGGHNIKTNYTHLDESAHYGHFYYRLKSIDADESFKYSKIISVIASGEGVSLAIYPNPLRGPAFNIKVNQSSSASRLTLYDESGRIHIDYSLKEGDNQIPVSGLSNGMYIVRITGRTLIKTSKLIVAR